MSGGLLEARQERFNPYKLSVLFVGQRRTVQNRSQTLQNVASDQDFHCLLAKYAIYCACSLLPCGQLKGKGLPLGSCL